MNCRKCNEKIPTKKIVDGKERNLQNRKFCLTCSPFGSRNTKTDDPQREPVRSKVYSEWTEDQKERNRAMQYGYRHRRIKKAVDLKGGECNRCGYSKCIRSLQFHHTDPALKQFELNSRTMLSHSWDSIVKELDKCELLCANCHSEHHYNEYESKYSYIFDEMSEKWGVQDSNPCNHDYESRA